MKSYQLLALFVLSGFTLQAKDYVRLDQELLAQKSARITQSQETRLEPTVTGNSISRDSDPLKNSTILSFNGKWTFVPKGAVINIPERYSARILKEGKGEGELVPFPVFMRANYGWLATKEVNQEQIIGEGKSNAGLRTNLEYSKYVVIATREKSPVTTHFNQKSKET